jgi:hypothetical protein
VIHRDVKPANVLLDDADSVHLTDFGISRLVGGQSLTGTSGVVGTADHMAPEVLRRLPLTPAVDVYSCGCLLYEMLTGRPPFTGDAPASVLLAHLESVPDRPSGLPDPLWRLLSGMLEKRPESRPSTREASAQLAQYETASDVLPFAAAVSDGESPTMSHRQPDRTSAPPTDDADVWSEYADPDGGETLLRHKGSVMPVPPAAEASGTDQLQRRRQVILAVAGLLLLAAAAVFAVPYMSGQAASRAQAATTSSAVPLDDSLASQTDDPAAEVGAVGAAGSAGAGPGPSTLDAPRAPQRGPSSGNPADADRPGAQGESAADPAGGRAGPDDPPAPPGAAQLPSTGPSKISDPVTPDPVTPDPITPDPVTPDPVTPDPVPTTPPAPVAAHWVQEGGRDMPMWRLSDEDGGSAVSRYVLILHDLTAGTSEQVSWSPEEVGVNHLGCLNNNWPQGSDHSYRFTVSAVNAVGAGPSSTSNDIVGQRC